MARLWTVGFEVDEYQTGTVNLTDFSGSAFNGGTGSRDATVARSGASSMKFAMASGNSRSVFCTIAPALGTGVFARMYFRVDALPVSAFAIMIVNNILVKLSPTGKLQLFNTTATQLGSDSTLTVATSTWYRVEANVLVNTGTIDTAALRVAGPDEVDETVASLTSLNINDSVTTAAQFGVCQNTGGTLNIWVDDVAVNDSTGSAQTSWAGPGSVALLRPTADSAVGTGWTDGAAATTNLWTSVDNTPPTGVTDTASTGGGKIIRNATANASVNYDATMTTYTAAGIAAADTINVVVPVVSTAAPVVTSAKLGTYGIVSNPTIANISLGAGGTSGAFWGGAAGGTYPTGWKTSFGTTTYAPSVTLGTAPVARITQTTSSTRIADVEFMGLYVDYTVGVAAGIPDVLTARTRT